MSYLKFNHVFMGLMGLSLATAFVLPQRHANRAHPEIQALFAPVSMPVGAVARGIKNRISPDISPDRRADNDVKLENLRLWSELSRVTKQLSDLQEREQERSKIGKIKDLFAPYPVVGGDPGPRESLQIRGSSMEGLRDGMFVLYSDGGVAGQIQRAGLGGAQVRLITDLGFRIRARFSRFENKNGRVSVTPVPLSQALVEGIGRNRMVVRGLPYQEVRNALKVGDAVVLDEPDWPSVLQGKYLGHVTAIEKRKDAPQFAEIRIEPRETLLRLREVMVMTREQ